MTAGRVITQARATGAATIAPQEVGRYATLIDKDVAPDIAKWLPLAPPTTLSDDVGPSLFVGVDRFF
jgi:hypothetical protein